MDVISLGGSIVAPDAVDVGFVVQFRAMIQAQVEARKARFVLVVGGGAPARAYQAAAREAATGGGVALSHEAQDWIGVMATRLNAELIKAVMGPLCVDPVVLDPTADPAGNGSVTVAAGWKPGFSTDYDAVVLADRLGAHRIINLSNIAHVYDADPKTNPDAKPVETMSWATLVAMVGTDWVPGANAPFDPVATRRAADLGLTLVVAGGRDVANTQRILNGEDFVGTTVTPS